MQFKIRQEASKDYTTVEHLIEKAFNGLSFSDQTEHTLVHHLRQSENFVPQLSLVAENDNKIIGHILFSQVWLQTSTEKHLGLSLAPVSVLPAFQNQGIGSALIQYAHEIIESDVYKFIVVIGHEDYYPKFGYKPFNQKQFTLPWKIPAPNAMMLLLDNKILPLQGNFLFDKAFL